MDQLESELMSLRRDDVEQQDDDRILSSDDDEGDCHLNIADEVLSLSVHSKAINTSYINLGRHNPHI